MKPAIWCSVVMPPEAEATPRTPPAVKPGRPRRVKRRRALADPDDPRRRLLRMEYVGMGMSPELAAAAADMAVGVIAGALEDMETDDDKAMAARDAKVRALHAAGLSLRKLGQRFGLSKTQIGRIVRSDAAGCPVVDGTFNPHHGAESDSDPAP